MDSLTALIDAVARGHLSLAEVSALSETELDALYELAAERLDTGRLPEAIAIFAGLVALFPFSARYWRGLGVAQHRSGAYPAAVAAYAASLALEPEHARTRCYRGEANLHLGRKEAALADLETVCDASSDIAERARRWLRIARRAQSPATGSPSPTQSATTESFEFYLSDTQRLPLAESPCARARGGVAEAAQPEGAFASGRGPAAARQLWRHTGKSPESAAGGPEPQAPASATGEKPPHSGGQQAAASVSGRGISRGDTVTATQPAVTGAATGSGSGSGAGDHAWASTSQRTAAATRTTAIIRRRLGALHPGERLDPDASETTSWESDSILPGETS